jgi:peptidoglycan/xylan/chitin deacetylase (PgdA/CDA1 family)
MLLIVAVIFGAAALAHTAPFPFLLEAFRPSRSLWHVKPQPGAPQTVYLTFDDGPNPDWTPPLLDVLRETGVRATFFLIDEHVTSETAPIVKRMADDGHAIGLHSGTRRLMVMAPEDLARRLRNAAARISAVAGRKPCRLFRPHAGWRSGSMYEGLVRIDYRLVGWSWGLWDWNWYRPHDAARLAERLGRAVSPGDIVVMHDGHHENPAADRRYAIEATRQLVPELRAQGYRFGVLCEPLDSTP